MATNRRILNLFLGRHAGKPALAFEAMEYLGPLFRLTDECRCVLAPAAALDGAKAAAAIAAATGLPAVLVKPVSLTRPFANPKGLGDAEYAAELQPRVWAALARAADPKFGACLRPQIAALRASLGEGRWDGLWQSLDSALWFELWNGLRRDLAIGIDDGLATGLHDSLRLSLLAFLGHALAGNKDGLDRFRDLILMLPRAAPLGRKKGDPDTWIVLAA